MKKITDQTDMINNCDIATYFIKKGSPSTVTKEVTSIYNIYFDLTI